MVLTLVSIGTLLGVLALCAIIWWGIQNLGLPQPVTVIGGVIVAIVAVIAILRFVGISIG